jgi:hypothetical protein
MASVEFPDGERDENKAPVEYEVDHQDNRVRTKVMSAHL